MSEYLKQINDEFRINFIGKPFELNKLIFNNSTIIENKKEADAVIKAGRVFKGWQFLGQATTLGFIMLSSYLSKKMNFTRKTQMKFIILSFAPVFGFYFYSHFAYWNICRDVVLVTREREKSFAHLNQNEIEDYKITYNHSKDFHTYIQSNLGVFDSLREVFKTK